MIESYKKTLESFNTRFEEYKKELVNDGGDNNDWIPSGRFTKLTRNWILELDNILNFRPIFNPEPNIISTQEELEIYQLFIRTAQESIEIWKKVMEKYNGSMSKKLSQSLKNTALPKLEIKI